MDMEEIRQITETPPQTVAEEIAREAGRQLGEDIALSQTMEGYEKLQRARACEIIDKFNEIHIQAAGLEGIDRQQVDAARDKLTAEETALFNLIDTVFVNEMPGPANVETPAALEEKDAATIYSDILIAFFTICEAYLEEMASYTEIMKSEADQGERRRLYGEALSVSIVSHIEAATDCVKGLQRVFNSMEKETRDRLYSFGKFSYNFYHTWIKLQDTDPDSVEESINTLRQIRQALTGSSGNMTLPKYRLIPHDIVSNSIKKRLNKGETILNIPYRNTTLPASFEVTSPVIGIVNGVTIYGDYSPQHELALQSLCTFWAVGQRRSSLAQLYRDMYESPKANPKDNTLREIYQLLDQMNNMDIMLDVSEWAEKTGRRFTGYKTKLIHVGFLTEPSKDLANVEFLIEQEPAILRYAEETGQIWKLNRKQREIRKVTVKGAIIPGNKGRIELTKGRLAIINYLIKRVFLCREKQTEAIEKYNKYAEKQRRNKLQINKTLADFESNYSIVTFEALFKETELDGCTNKQKVRYKDFAEDCLKYWKATEFIKGYEVVDGERKNGPKGFRLIV